MYNELNNEMNEMKRYFFDRSTTDKFAKFLMSQAELIAPHQKGDTSYSYEVVTSENDIIYNYTRTIQPLKKYFLPPKETLLSFDSEKNEFNEEAIDIKDRIFFAIHSLVQLMNWVI